MSGIAMLATVLGAAIPAATASAAPGPAAAPARAAAADIYIDIISKISCGSAKKCLAIGLHQNYASGADAPVAEAWNGTAWRSVTVPEPKGAMPGFTILTAVSCKSATSCLVVGNYNTAKNYLPYALTWNGTSLKPAVAPLVPKNGGGMTMDAVSCATAKSCVAIGSGGRAVETWNGAKWAVRTAAVPGSAGSLFDAPMALSCLSATSCVWAGGTYVSANKARTLLETWNGKAFTAMKMSASANPNLFSVDGLSCVSAKSCVATGLGATSASGDWTGSALVWNGKSWTGSKVSWPKGTAQSELFGVSCTSPDSCIAVGTAGTANYVSARAEYFNGKTWTRQTVPGPGKGKSSAFYDVSCPKAGDCVAIGELGDFDLNTAAGTPPQVGGMWNGKTWKLARA